MENKKKNIFNKLSFFFSQDIRNKLKIVGKVLSLNFYPKYFINPTYLDKIKFIFISRLILNNKIKRLKKFYKANLNLENEKKFTVLTSFPRSGTNFANSILSSYLEIFYKLGNGDFLYNAELDRYEKIIDKYYKRLDIFNSINFDNTYNYYLENKPFDRKLVLNGGHFPITDINNVDVKNLDFILLTRKKIEDSLASYYIFKNINNSDPVYKIDKEKLDEIIKIWNNFNDFWKTNKYDLNLKKVYFEDIILNPFDEIKKILIFAGIEVNEKILIDSIKINDLKNVENKIFFNQNSQRITNKKHNDFKNKLKEEILKII